MYFRNIRLRARTALPFLLFDGDPYLVVTDSGRLRWILDAYTATSGYPYAQPLADGTNYMRNSVKVVIDAFDGTVTAYLADPRDPLVLTLAKVFPGIFQPLDAMSADLRAHLRYPEDLFRVQTDLDATYHMAEPDVFYHPEDQCGSEVTRGTLLVIPIEESLIYVQPLSLRAEGGRIPEMKRVVVAHQTRVVMEETLEAGLARLLGGGVEPAAAAAAATGAAGPGDGRAADLARRAAESYQRAVEAQRSGDWARYGAELSQLGEALRQLQAVLGARQP